MKLKCTAEKSEKKTARPSWRRRALKIVLWIAAVPVALAVLLTIYFYIGGIEWGDWTIPNEASLRLELRDVPDEENAYLALQALTNLYHVAESDDESTGISDEKFVFYYGDPFFPGGFGVDRDKWVAARSNTSSPKRVEKILAENAEFFECFRKALSLRGFAETDVRSEDAKRIKEGKPLSTYDSSLYKASYKPFVIFSWLIYFRAQVALERGDVEAAVSDIGEIHALGQLFKVNSESLVGLLLGLQVERCSYQKMCDAVAMGKVTNDNLEQFNRMLDVGDENVPVCRERAIQALWIYYGKVCEWCRHAPADRFLRFLRIDSEGEFLMPISAEIYWWRLLWRRLLWNWPGYARYSLHRHETLFRVAEIARTAIANEESLELEEKSFLLLSSRYLLSSNNVGNHITTWMCLHCNEINDSFKFYGLKCIRPRLVLAAEKWRRAHGGENPPTLDALVPDYLAAVPKDPWCKSGEPIKYDAALGIAWSVGKDGTYDYRKIAKDNAAGSDVSVDADTQKYAFRLDGKPISALPEPVGANDQSQAAR